MVFAHTLNNQRLSNSVFSVSSYILVLRYAKSGPRLKLWVLYPWGVFLGWGRKNGQFKSMQYSNVLSNWRRRVQVGSFHLNEMHCGTMSGFFITPLGQRREASPSQTLSFELFAWFLSFFLSFKFFTLNFSSIFF